MERIPPVRTHPKIRGSQIVCLDIPPNKEESKRADANAIESIKVYSDGSAHNGGVGWQQFSSAKGKRIAP